jgi:hypothetical protein
MLRVKCTNCDKTIKCPPERAGDDVVCPHCRVHFVVPMDSPDVDAVADPTSKPPTTARPPKPPAPAEPSPASLDDLVKLQIQHHAEICERLDKSRADMQEMLQNIAGNARGTRVNTMIIGILFLLLALPILAISACGMYAAATSPSPQELLQQQLQEFSDPALQDLLQ